MGKRSNFERKENDFYPTPREAVAPLLNDDHMKPGLKFIEPCCGDLSLVRHLESNPTYNLKCVKYSDKYPQDENVEEKDAVNYTWQDVYGLGADLIITNPPWKWSMLEPIISGLVATGFPVILLLKADIAYNKRTAPFLKYCRKIVAVGRVSWMGNNIPSKENVAWYFFDRDYNDWPVFYGRS